MDQIMAEMKREPAETTDSADLGPTKKRRTGHDDESRILASQTRNPEPEKEIKVQSPDEDDNDDRPSAEVVFVEDINAHKWVPQMKPEADADQGAVVQLDNGGEVAQQQQQRRDENGSNSNNNENRALPENGLPEPEALDKSNNTVGANKRRRRDKHSDVIGIDLGTTYSLVGVWKVPVGERQGHVELLRNEQDKVMTPSCVSFLDNGDELVGHEALKQRLPNRPNTIFDIKRIIGRQWSDPVVQKLIKRWPFKVVADETDCPLVEIQWPDGTKFKYSPTDLQSRILYKLRQIAQERLGRKITQAVITHPAYFGQLQKQETKQAARDAGFDTVHLLSEPTAAAYFYGFDEKRFDGYNLLVFDLGGGTFDCTILKVEDHEFHTVAIDGIEHLGGRDFDHALGELIKDKIRVQHALDAQEPAVAQKLLVKCQALKECLTDHQSVSFDLELLFPAMLRGEDTRLVVVTRAEFEAKCMPLAEQCMQKVRDIVARAKLRNDEIDEVLMVGGSSRVPLLHALLKREFPVRKLNFSKDADEAVARGATLRAAQHCDRVKYTMPCWMNILEATPLSIGILGYGDKFVRIIDRNTRFPVKRHKRFITRWVRGTCSPTYIIVEGERLVGKEGNNVLGVLRLPDLLPYFGHCETTVTLKLDEQGILHATAWNAENRKLAKLTVAYAEQSVAKAQGPGAPGDMIGQAQGRRAEDEKHLERTRMVKQFLDTVRRTQWELYDSGINHPKRAQRMHAVRQRKNALCEEFEQWLQLNRHTASLDALRAKQRAFRRALVPIEEDEARYETDERDSDDEVCKEFARKNKRKFANKRRRNDDDDDDDEGTSMMADSGAEDDREEEE